MGLKYNSLWIYGQTEASKVSVKSKAWNIVEQMSNNYIRDSITKGQFFIFREFFKNLLSSSPYRVFISDNIKTWFHCLQKSNSNIIVYPVSKKCNSLTYNIPGSIKHNIIALTVLQQYPGLFKINILWTKGGKEE